MEKNVDNMLSSLIFLSLQMQCICIRWHIFIFYISAFYNKVLIALLQILHRIRDCFENKTCAHHTVAVSQYQVGVYCVEVYKTGQGFFFN